MATSSITKKYVIKDDNACDKLIQVLTENKFTRKKKPASKKYEEGKKLLVQYNSCSESRLAMKRLTVWDEELGSFLYADGVPANNIDERDLINYIGVLEDKLLNADNIGHGTLDNYLDELFSTIESAKEKQYLAQESGPIEPSVQ